MWLNFCRLKLQNITAVQLQQIYCISNAVHGYSIHLYTCNVFSPQRGGIFVAECIRTSSGAEHHNIKSEKNQSKKSNKYSSLNSISFLANISRYSSLNVRFL